MNMINYTSSLKSPSSNNPLTSKKMKSIKGKNTKPELIVRKFLFAKGLRYYVNFKELLGKPDIVFLKNKILIFVNGCFWHAHPGCYLNKLPKTNLEYWIPKINNNIYRDKQNYRLLKKMGWRIIVIWECETKDINKLNSLYEKIIKSKRIKLI